MEGIAIRKMSHDDIPLVYAIETRCFTTPWSISSFKYELTYRQAILKVAVFNNQIVGYVCLRIILGVTHVLNLVVLPEFRRRGIGSMLLQDAMQELISLQPVTDLMILEVRESNTAAIKLYEKFGFNVIGKRIGYYQKPSEDAVMMELRMGEKL